MIRLSQEELVKLRKEITLCSLYLKDYRNSFGFDPERMQRFFEGYAEYLEELMEIGDYPCVDARFFSYLKDFDNIETLQEYYNEMDDETLAYYFEKPSKLDVAFEILTAVGMVIAIGEMIIGKLILAGKIFF